MIKIFQNNILLSYIAVAVLLMVFSLPILFGIESANLIFYNWYEDAFEFIIDSKWLNYFLTFGILYITIVVLINSFNKTNFFNKSSSIPALIYILILSTFNGFNFGIELIVNLLLALVMSMLFTLDQNKSARHTAFIGGLLIGVAMLFSYLILPIGLLVWLGLIIFRPFFWKEWFLNLFGMFIPYLYYISLEYLLDKDFNIYLDYSATYSFNWIDYSSFTALFLIIAVSILEFSKFLRSTTVLERKQIRLLVYLFLITAIISSIIFFTKDVFLNCFSVPLALLLSVVVTNLEKNKFINFLIVALILLNFLRIFIF